MPNKNKAKTKKRDYIYAVGRRKTANARVRLYEEKFVPGTEKVKFLVNGMPAEQYFPGELNKIALLRPFQLTNTSGELSASIKVVGSGKSGQLDAVVHGLSRALTKLNPEAFHKPLKDAGLLTRDPRAKERRKVGTGGKARRQKQSPKR